MTEAELARGYFPDWEIEYAMKKADPVAELTRFANDRETGIYTPDFWMDTGAGKVRVFLDGRSPPDDTPDLVVSIRRISELVVFRFRFGEQISFL